MFYEPNLMMCVCLVTATLFYETLTYDNKCVVDVHAAKPIGSFTDVSPCIIGLHLFNTQGLLQHLETRPAAVDVATVFSPHDEWRGVALHGTGQLHGATQTDALPVDHFF